MFVYIRITLLEPGNPRYLWISASIALNWRGSEWGKREISLIAASY